MGNRISVGSSAFVGDLARTHVGNSSQNGRTTQERLQQPCMPCTYINHGGGPMPLLGQQPDVADFLKFYAEQFPARPSAVLVVTAHWETSKCFFASAGEHHPLLFDYGGFPDETYNYTYAAPGSPALAKRIQSLLQDAGILCDLDASRGWDHGVFVPLKLMFPKADTPVVALSVLASQDALAHLQVGKALRPLRDEGILILGSGVSFHNMRVLMAKDPAARRSGSEHARAWDSFLAETVESQMPAEERLARFAAWERCPSARQAHPIRAAEHLMPLFVVAGAAEGNAGRRLPYRKQASPLMRDIAISQFEFA